VRQDSLDHERRVWSLSRANDIAFLVSVILHTRPDDMTSKIETYETLRTSYVPIVDFRIKEYLGDVFETPYADFDTRVIWAGGRGQG
jgi:hypothetical protein